MTRARITPSSARTGWTASVLALLAGCSSMSGLDGESHYACQAPIGVACDSVSGTYANAVRNNLPTQRAAPAVATPHPATPDTSGATLQPAQSRTMSATLPPLASTGAGAGAGNGPGPNPPADTALRSPPRVLRLWTQAWEDRDGDLHDQTYVYVLVDSGQWRMAHIRQQTRQPVRQQTQDSRRAALMVPPTPGRASIAQTPGANDPTQTFAGRSAPVLGEPQRPTPRDVNAVAPATARSAAPLLPTPWRVQHDRP
jgi:conjugal transfer pilus assembly protein TraV